MFITGEISITDQSLCACS